MGAKPRAAIKASRQIAFLRAINVGGHVVKMDRLREMFTELGLANVETFIAAHTAFPSPVDGTVGLYIGFLGARPAAEAKAALMAFRNETDDFHVHGREVYWLCRARYSDSTFSGSRLERCLGMPATMRNITSVQRLLGQHGG